MSEAYIAWETVGFTFPKASAISTVSGSIAVPEVSLLEIS